jgi:predicted GNAT family acetyltransferase
VAGASALSLERPGDPATFQRIVSPFLDAHEAENHLTISLIAGMVAGRSWGSGVYLGAVRHGDRIVGAALRAGLYLIVTTGTTDDALRILVADAAGATPDAPGIIGPKELARRAVEIWTARTGQRARVQVAERIYRLSRVIPPRAASGRMRPATAADLDLLTEWFLAFVLESQPYIEASVERARENAARWIESGKFRLWDDDGIVSMAGAAGPTAHGIRVAAVYTPPERRGHGYASNLVAALSQEQLDSGREFCFLFTDLANPTSNKIYADIGYEPIIDVDQYVFES